MKKVVVLFLLIGIVFSSCQNVKHAEKPQDLIPEDKMVDIITDLSVVGAARNYNQTLFNNTGLDPEKFVYDKYGIDSLQLKRSNDYYADNYTTYERIYESVKDRLEDLKEKTDSLYELDVKRKDSIAQQKMKKGDSTMVDTVKSRRRRPLIAKPLVRGDSVVVPRVD
ncbi:MAG: DUF4296 domain-containing protein [Salegentibacter sp.]